MALFGFFSKGKTGVKVGDIMTRNFVHVYPDTSIIDCAKEMIKKHVGSLVVKEGRNINGILAEKDVIWAIVKKQDLTKLKARDIMSRRVITIAPSKDLYDALEIMKRTRFKHLPVTVKSEVIGLVTLKDILRLEPSLFGSVREALLIREEAEKLKAREARTGKKELAWIKEGECSECGAYGLLYNIDNKLLCEMCKNTED